MGCNIDFDISDNELMLTLEEEDLLALFEMMDEEMQLFVNEVELNNRDDDGDVDTDVDNNNVEDELFVNEVELNNRDDHADNDNKLMYDGDIDTDTDTDTDNDNELMYDGDIDTDADSDSDNEDDQQNRPATLALLMGNIPEYPPLPPIPQTPPTILHPAQPDPAQVLSWQIYNFSRQIDEYLDEYISDLQQNAPSPPTIYYHPIRFTENLENGHQILDVVKIDIASIHY